MTSSLDMEVVEAISVTALTRDQWQRLSREEEAGGTKMRMMMKIKKKKKKKNNKKNKNKKNKNKNKNENKNKNTNKK